MGLKCEPEDFTFRRWLLDAAGLAFGNAGTRSVSDSLTTDRSIQIMHTPSQENADVTREIHHFGGDQSPLNDADADEDRDPEAYLDLDILGLGDFVDADKLDPVVTGDIGSSTLG